MLGGRDVAMALLPRLAGRDEHDLVEVPALAISSTDCRDRVHRGSPVWYLVPDGVVQYIEKRNLYREGPRRAVVDGARNAAAQPPPDSLQEVPR